MSRRPARTAYQRLQRALARTLAFVGPNQCALCGHFSSQTLCTICDAAYWNEPLQRCAQCAVPLAPRRQSGFLRYRCGTCATTPPPFDATLTLADYRAPLDRLALDLKFHARLALGREFAVRLARLATDTFGPAHQIDIIAPVPLARRRLAERGYNQAWAIARPLAQALHVRAVATLIARTTATAPQSQLTVDARHRNVATAFTVTRTITGLHIALVDDVMTSGATLRAIAQQLKAAGARRVTNFVALRTAPH